MLTLISFSVDIRMMTTMIKVKDFGKTGSLYANSRYIQRKYESIDRS